MSLNLPTQYLLYSGCWLRLIWQCHNARAHHRQSFGEWIHARPGENFFFDVEILKPITEIVNYSSSPLVSLFSLILT